MQLKASSKTGFTDITPGQGSATASSARNSSSDAVYLISGASRGIGLEFAKQILERTRGRVVALCRDPSSSKGLCDLVSSGDGRLHTIAMDLERQASIDNIPNALENLDIRRVDVLLNVAASC